MFYVSVFHVLKLFQVVHFSCISIAFRCPVLAPYTTNVNSFCIISVHILGSDTTSMITPLWLNLSLLLAYLESAYSLICGTHRIWGYGSGEVLVFL